MPFYTCVCIDCGRVFTVALNRESELEGTQCPSCGSRRINVVPPEFVSAGGG